MRSKYDPYEDQIRSLLSQGYEIKTVSHMLTEQGLESNYNALYACADGAGWPTGQNVRSPSRIEPLRAWKWLPERLV